MQTWKMKSRIALMSEMAAPASTSKMLPPSAAQVKEAGNENRGPVRADLTPSRTDQKHIRVKKSSA